MRRGRNESWNADESGDGGDRPPHLIYRRAGRQRSRDMSPKRRRRGAERNQGGDPDELDLSLVEGTAGLADDSRVAQCWDQARNGASEALQLGRNGKRRRFWHAGYDIKREGT